MLRAAGHTYIYADQPREKEKKKIRLLPRSIIVEFEKWDSKELHIFGNGKNFYGKQKDVSVPWEGKRSKRDQLRSGICTRKSFLHSLGLVMCAGTNGY